MKPEILAPAGGKEQLLAAVRSGADAVYLGASAFNARRNAGNFSDDELYEAAAYCRERGVKVYAAVNILIGDTELPALRSLAKRLYETGIDGVILQDLAAAKIFRVCCPDLALHASTQMTIHNRAGLRALEELGFSRFVPARELTGDEIRHLAQSTEMETEVFIHGALCMSVSGCCYLSAMLGGRSGNRGLCAQACRLNFTHDGREYALSLKDLSALRHIAALTEAGVDSLKIEGRMKRPEYVAAAVTACKNARDGLPYDEETLRRVFSRSGFTDGYLTGRRDLSMFGMRTKEDVTAATESVFASLRELYRKERPAVSLSASLTVTPEESTLSLSDGVHTVKSCGEGGQSPRQMPLTKEGAARQIEKTGGTPYVIDRFDFSNSDRLYLSASACNRLRRDALEQLSYLRRKPPERVFMEMEEPLVAQSHTFRGYYLRFSAAEQFFDGDYEKAFVPLDVLLTEPERFRPLSDKLIAECPALVFPLSEETVRQKLLRLREWGFTMGSCENIGQLMLLRECGFVPFGGMGLNLLNSQAAEEYRALGLAEGTVSFEADVQKIRRLQTALPLTAVGYGYLPLMKYRVCPLQTANGCVGCGGRGELIDRKGVAFTVACEKRQFSVLYNSVPLDVLGRDFSFVEHILLYFTGESADDCRRIYASAKKRQTAAAVHTTGLYYRDLL